MTWSDFYLICFLVGFGLSVLSLLAGSVHLHLPHLHLHHRHRCAPRARRRGGPRCRHLRGSTSAPSPPSWPGSAAPAICCERYSASGS